METETQTLIIGAGQAGLVTSQALSRRGIDHLLLERTAVAHKWRSERWDSLLLQQPNWLSHLPDFPYPPAADDPGGFPTAAEMHAFLTAFADHIAAPVRTGVNVERLTFDAARQRFRAETTEGSYTAASVVIATGGLQIPTRPDLIEDRDDLLQMPASAYRNPAGLPEGATLVVGGGNSGCQIAEDINRAGRKVILALGRQRRVPRHYRGKDIFWWFGQAGQLTTPPEAMPADSSPIVFAGGGNTIDMRRLARDGILVTGSLAGIEDDCLLFNDDLAAILDHGDRHYFGLLDEFDRLAEEKGFRLPRDPGARTIWSDAPCIAEPLRRVALSDDPVSSVIWATGYRSDYGWIDLPAFTPEGRPRHRQGVSVVPGLYFIGLGWQVNLSSSFLFGVQNDAALIAEAVAAGLAAGAA